MNLPGFTSMPPRTDRTPPGRSISWDSGVETEGRHKHRGAGKTRLGLVLHVEARHTLHVSTARLERRHPIFARAQRTHAALRQTANPSLIIPQRRWRKHAAKTLQTRSGCPALACLPRPEEVPPYELPNYQPNPFCSSLCRHEEKSKSSGRISSQLNSN